MLKPLAPLGMAKTMRHLSVPSKETSLWREKLASEGWLAEGCGIHNLGEMRGLALNSKAPIRIADFEIMELDPILSGPKHWTEHLNPDLFLLHENEWPMSHDQIGDVIIVKVPEVLINYHTEIGAAMLQQHSNARVVCADNGVKGEFRVRDLTIISHKHSATTRTKVKESGSTFWVDPGQAYYSPRLANERIGTVECAKNLSSKLGRKISVCDPYAGVGPALMALNGLQDSIKEIFASDLNPKAAELLSLNLPDHWTACRDARNLANEFPECCDLLLVNLPHNSISHLPDLLGLLRKGHEVVIRGWAILALDSLSQAEIEIRAILSECEILSLTIEANRSYSPNDTYACIEAHIVR
tara:strand:- start:772 stop:1839 length:1068 start_codon:yes stop_codon:yes gene_type:complete